VFGVGVPELVVAGAVVVAAILLWRHASPARWVRVDEARHVAVLAAALEGPFARLLSDLPATDLHAGGRSTWTLSVARPQSWSYVPAVLLFPMGLLFLLFRDTATLVVVVRPAADGAEVHLLGTTRLSVMRTLERALAELPGGDRSTVDVAAAP
jgi:hypothetical protein